MIKHCHCTEFPLLFGEVFSCVVVHFISMFLFYVTNLTLYASICWFCTVTTARSLLFILSCFLIFYFFPVVFQLFLCLVFCENDLLAGPTVTFESRCMFKCRISFVCVCACCSTILEIQMKLSLVVSSHIKFISMG